MVGAAASEAAPQVCRAGGYCSTSAASQPRCLEMLARGFCSLMMGMKCISQPRKHSPAARLSKLPQMY